MEELGGVERRRNSNAHLVIPGTRLVGESSRALDLFTGVTKSQLLSICNLFGLTFYNSVCNVNHSDSGEELRSLRPPWGILGLGYSLRDETFNIANYSSHPALGILAEQLVRKGFADA